MQAHTWDEWWSAIEVPWNTWWRLARDAYQPGNLEPWVDFQSEPRGFLYHRHESALGRTTLDIVGASGAHVVVRRDSNIVKQGSPPLRVTGKSVTPPAKRPPPPPGALVVNDVRYDTLYDIRATFPAGGIVVGTFVCPLGDSCTLILLRAPEAPPH